MHGRGHVWQGCVHGRGCMTGQCMAYGHAWQGVCIAGGCVVGAHECWGAMHGRAHAWLWGLCMVGGVWQERPATTADGTHPTGMHSC